MLVAVGMTIAASYTDFHPSLAFHYPHGAFGGGFVAALGAGLLIAIYDYLGYNTVAYMGGELRNPGRVMPRAIIISIFTIMAFYLAMNIGVLGFCRGRRWRTPPRWPRWPSPTTGGARPRMRSPRSSW